MTAKDATTVMETSNIAPAQLPIRDPDAPDVVEIIHRGYRDNAPITEIVEKLCLVGHAPERREAHLREWLRFSEFFQQLQLYMDNANE